MAEIKVECKWQSHQLLDFVPIEKTLYVVLFGNLFYPSQGSAIWMYHRFWVSMILRMLSLRWRRAAYRSRRLRFTLCMLKAFSNIV